MVDTTKWNDSGGLLLSCTKGKTDQKESFNLVKNSFIYHQVTNMGGCVVIKEEQNMNGLTMTNITKWDDSGGLLPSCAKGKTGQKEPGDLLQNSFIYQEANICGTCSGGYLEEDSATSRSIFLATRKAPARPQLK